MFYSHTFLARKSPLGTVWIAAHLEQRRIKKSHVEKIDISSFADCIMFPEVPIALRLSGHLLLGLVRIYSWKVNYAFQDCNRLLTDIRKVFPSGELNFPEDADRAPYESITLPDTFELDALKLDDAICQLEGMDCHLKKYEEITTAGHVSTEDKFVRFIIHENDDVDQSSLPKQSTFDAQPMELDILPPMDVDLQLYASPIETATRDGNMASNNETEVLSKTCDDSILSQELSPIEVVRDDVHGPEPVKFKETNNDIPSHDNSIAMNRRDGLSPIMEVVSVSGCVPQCKASNATFLDDHSISNSGISLGKPEFKLQQSPIEKKKPNTRKRKGSFDESIVLSNLVMKKQLEDTSKLVRKRGQLPFTALDLWKYQYSLQKEHAFDHSSLTGMCSSLQGIYERTIPPATINKSARLEASVTRSNAESDVLLPDIEEPEHPRFDAHVNYRHESVPPPSGIGEFTPSVETNFESVSHIDNTMETDFLPTFECTVPADSTRIEPSTSFASLDEEREFYYTNIPEIPRLLGYPDGEDLSFLETDNESYGNVKIDIDNLPSRTRAIAQYLKDRSPVTEISKGESGNISLNKILYRKPRRQAARMFYETVVLKSLGLIDVEQLESYGDITIKFSSFSEAKL